VQRQRAAERVGGPGRLSKIALNRRVPECLSQDEEASGPSKDPGAEIAYEESSLRNRPPGLHNPSLVIRDFHDTDASCEGSAHVVERVVQCTVYLPSITVNRNAAPPK